MKCLIEAFVECANGDYSSTAVLGTRTDTVNRESPDNCASSAKRMRGTRTAAKEHPDRAFIPKRLIS